MTLKFGDKNVAPWSDPAAFGLSCNGSRPSLQILIAPSHKPMPFWGRAGQRTHHALDFVLSVSASALASSQTPGHILCIRSSEPETPRRPVYLRRPLRTPHEFPWHLLKVRRVAQPASENPLIQRPPQNGLADALQFGQRESLREEVQRQGMPFDLVAQQGNSLAQQLVMVCLLYTSRCV